MTGKKPASKHIILTSHPGSGARNSPPIDWGADTPAARGPIVGTVSNSSHRNVIGTHAGAYAVYRALAVAAGNLDPEHVPDLTDTAPAETIGPYPQWSERNKIVSLDPYGHVVSEVFAAEIDADHDIRPTIAVTKAHINVPELKGAVASGRLKPDGEILNQNGNVRVTKAAIDPVWYLPGIAERFGVGESALRRALFEHTAGMFTELVTRPDLKVFLPPIGGVTVYVVGNIGDLTNEGKNLACRVHDECNGSDVFGSDICTCRPYLVHGIEVCIETAQAGGAGIIVYNRKEGRALGEVTKFLVYNARKRQVGGDRAEAYFERTECVAGVQDMRFQELMPDVLHWLGVRKIDRFVSMSDLKHASIVNQGIDIREQISIPDELIPTNARRRDRRQEGGRLLHCRCGSGRSRAGHTQGPAAHGVIANLTIIADACDAVRYLRSPAAIRARCSWLLDLAQRGDLAHFVYDEGRLDEAARYTAEVIRESYPDLEIPMHSRWRHFDVGDIDRAAKVPAWVTEESPAALARCRFELATTSVLLDAGAGQIWHFREPETGRDFSRSEGLALASYHAFAAGVFSSDEDRPYMADADGLQNVTARSLGQAFQAGDHNPLVGLAGRVELVRRLGAVVGASPSVFGSNPARLGNLFDYLATRAAGKALPANELLETLLSILAPIWPGRVTLGGVNLGDVWRHPAIETDDATDGLVPLHKLPQWLAYSLVEPLESAGITVTSLDALTGLAEYRNGGLLVDLEVLRPRYETILTEILPVDAEAVVEWRALTVAILDLLAERVRAELGVTDAVLPLARLLEGGTWRAGRKIARELRPDGAPPIMVDSDGTVF